MNFYPGWYWLGDRARRGPTRYGESPAGSAPRWAERHTPTWPLLFHAMARWAQARAAADVLFRGVYIGADLFS